MKLYLVSGLFIVLISQTVSCRTHWTSSLSEAGDGRVKNYHPYYGSEGNALIQNAHATQGRLSASKERTLRQQLWTILNSAHVRQKGQVDKLQKNCVNFDQQDDSKIETKVESKFERPAGGKACVENQRYSYPQARSYMFGDERFHLRKDTAGDYYVTDVYCKRSYFVNKIRSSDGRSFTPAAKPFNIGPMRIPRQHRIINTEHTWPKSRFRYFARKYESESMPGFLWKVADLHHLLPTDSNANSARANYYYSEVEQSDETQVANCPQNFVGAPIVTDEVRPMLGQFEVPKIAYMPPKDIRGDIARGLFYFAFRYDVVIHPLELYYLKKWHIQDPVDKKEMVRHNAVYELQNNRNPFIDFPFLVQKLSLASCVNCKDPNAAPGPYDVNAGSTPNSGGGNTPPPSNGGNQGGGQVSSPDQIGKFVRNPCHCYKGQPYRKYEGFALGKSGQPNRYTILKFSKQGATPKVESNPLWGSVQEFMDKKGITAACGNLEPKSC